MDYNARYYDPWLGRFISPDSIVPNPRNPQDLNRYSYVRSNPLRHTDPSGQVLCGGVNECSGGGYQAYSYYMSAQDTQTAVENAGKVVQAGAVGVLTLLGATVAIPYVYSAHAAVATASAAHPTAAAVVGGLAETAAECALTGGGCNAGDFLLGATTAGVASRASQSPDFVVTEDGIAIPTDRRTLNNALSNLTETSTNPATSRKFVGADSKGSLRVRIEKAHPSDPNFTGVPDPLHTVDHLHIDRRRNVDTGSWYSKEKTQYDWPFD